MACQSVQKAKTKIIKLISIAAITNIEITIKLARLKCRIYEMGISYWGRDYSEGKKITWKEPFKVKGYISGTSRCHVYPLKVHGRNPEISKSYLKGIIEEFNLPEDIFKR